MATSGNEVKISLRVYPNAGRNAMVSFNDGVLLVKILAPLTRGKANRGLIVFLSWLLSEWFAVPLLIQEW